MCGLSEDATMTKESAVIAKDGELEMDWHLEALVDSVEKNERGDMEKGSKSEHMLGNYSNSIQVNFQF